MANRLLKHLPLILAVSAGAAFYLHAMTAGRAEFRVRCVVETVDGDNPVDLTLRRDALVHTPFGLVVHPEGGRPFVATSCQEAP